jgi:hypothetical protein
VAAERAGGGDAEAEIEPLGATEIQHLGAQQWLSARSRVEGIAFNDRGQ